MKTIMLAMLALASGLFGTGCAHLSKTTIDKTPNADGSVTCKEHYWGYDLDVVSWPAKEPIYSDRYAPAQAVQPVPQYYVPAPVPVPAPRTSYLVPAPQTYQPTYLQAPAVQPRYYLSTRPAAYRVQRIPQMPAAMPEPSWKARNVNDEDLLAVPGHPGVFKNNGCFYEFLRISPNGQVVYYRQCPDPRRSM